MTDDVLRVGVLGAGPIAQFAHLEACGKAAGVRLHALCDTVLDLLDRMAATHRPDHTFTNYDDMLADPDLDAVVVAVSDAFHVAMALRALEAGKHVLCEKPMGVSVEEGERLAAAVHDRGLVLQVGHMKRFDPALEAARDFAHGEMGQHLALKAWYADSTHRYTNTDAVQPMPVTSTAARRPTTDPKADLARYHLLAHGSHLVDTARFLCGEITAVRARLLERFGAQCWFVDTEFASGVLGHLDLTVAVRMDWHEGFELHGEHGSIVARTFNPWYFRASEVQIFHESDATTRVPLGPDGHFFRRQLEGFADTIRHDAPMRGADVDDGLASIRALAAIARSTAQDGARVVLDDVTGAV